jgi:hypothetical protein
MAIWQYRLILIPEDVLLRKYDVLPLTTGQETVGVVSEMGYYANPQVPGVGSPG